MSAIRSQIELHVDIAQNRRLDSPNWRPDYFLKPLNVSQQIGTSMGSAKLAYVAIDGVLTPFEDVLAEYHPDDLVRISAVPAATDGRRASDERVLFVGQIARQRWEAWRQGDTEKESVAFIGIPLGQLENRLSEHQVYQRWMIDDDNLIFYPEAPALLPVVNFRGRPNCYDDGAVAMEATGLSSLKAHPWAIEGSSVSSLWTARGLLRSLLAVMLYGVQGKALTRCTDIEAQTLMALIYDGDGEPNVDDPQRFANLDDPLPEINLAASGRFNGVWDAVGKVCDAIGYEWSVRPVAQPSDSQRPCEFSMWRKGRGPLKKIKLAQRHDFSTSSHAADLRKNNAARLFGMRDSHRTCPEIFARGETLIECSLKLKPLWKPTDMDAAALTDSLQKAGETTYHQKHVSGGSQFADYGHVGRLWGLSCLDSFDGGYSEEIYKHTEKGADFKELLGFNSDTEGVGNKITLERASLSNGDVKQVKLPWTKRIRRLLPLQRPNLVAQGIQYIVEASEDGGGSWTKVSLRVNTLRDGCGIVLTGVNNLAAVNLDSLRTGEAPPIAKSWWARIQTTGDYKTTLQFRVTALVEVDFAPRYDALRQDTASTGWRKGQFVQADAQEIWAAPKSLYNNVDDFTKISGYSQQVGINYYTQIRAEAEAMQRAREGLRNAATMSTWVMDLDAYRPGDRVELQGRKFSLATNAGNTQIHPTVAGITYQLDNGQQWMTLSLADMSMTEGI